MKIKVHFNRGRRDLPAWTIHCKLGCFQMDEVVFHKRVQTVFQPERKRQPRAWLETYGEISFKNGVATIT